MDTPIENNNEITNNPPEEINEGFRDEVGGYHDCCIGWNPQGVWCGECGSITCKGCPNEFVKKKD